MKSNIYSKEGTVMGEMDLPRVFEFTIRDDLIRRAHRAISLSLRQPWGSYPGAGLRQVGHNMGPNHGMARIPRVSGSSRGVNLGSMVGGKSAHSPRTERRLYRKINKKERIMARYSAIASTALKERVVNRGHRIPEDVSLPIIADDSVMTIEKAKDAVSFLKNVGIYDDVVRAKEGTKIRAGRGKMRNRKYKQPRSILMVSAGSAALNAFKGLPGVEIATMSSLSIRKLAPGGVSGRLAVFTVSALKELEKVNAE